MPSVRFILGRAGSGKTAHVVEQVAALCRADPLGPPVYWLLPKQATFQAERLLVATLGGFARVRVVDFGRLGQAVLDSCGDVGMPEVTPVGRRLIIGHLLRANRAKLRYYVNSAHRPGLAAELDATFGEFERAGLDADALAAVVDTLDAAADPTVDGLREKLADVHLLLAAYHAHVRDDRLDPKRRLDLVLKRVAGCSALANATLFVDDFYDFTAYERQLLAAVAAVVRRTEVALLLDPSDPAVRHEAPLADLSLFHRTTRTYHGLRRAFAALPVEPPLTLPGASASRTPGLIAVERGLFADAVPTGATVEFFDAPDARAEVDAVARQIRAAVTAGGLRLRDVAVLVRSFPDYQEIIAASFGEHGLRYFADHRRPAGHHPLLQLVRAALLVARGDWPQDAVMALAKCGLTGLTDDRADQLENYVLRHRIRGRSAWESPDPWAFAGELTAAEDDPGRPPSPSADADATRRRLLAGLRPLLAVSRAGPVPIRDLAAALFGAMEAFDVRTTLAGWMAAADAAGDVERREEHEQVWAELIALFDQMVDVIGEQRATVAGFLQILDSGLEGFDLAIAPPTVDEVLVGQIDRTRTPAVKLVFVLGLAEGKFPLVRREELVLSDAERRSLRSRQVELDEDTERQLFDERFLAYVAFTRPTQRLVVSRPLSDAARRATNPSVFWLELQRLCPAAVAHVPRSSAAVPETIGTPRQLVDALTRWVRTDRDESGGVLPALYQWFRGADPAGRVADLRRLAWPSLRYANVARLDPARAAELFTSPLDATVRQLEDAAACPFRHFAKHGLRLAEREAGDVTPLDLNNAYHQVIENLTADLLNQKTDWATLSADAARGMIRRHAAAVGQQLRNELMLSSARNRYLLDHIERTLERAVASMTEFTRRGRYRPAHVALRFGGHGSPPLPAHVVTTPAGREVHLRGRIDRVDLNDKGTAFVVADYKLTPASLALDRVYHGLSLQLLTYLLVVQADGERLTGRKVSPAAALLLGLLRSHETVPHPDRAVSPDDADFHLRHKPRGLIDGRAVDSLDGGGGGMSPVVAAYRKQDGTFGHPNTTDVADAAAFAGLLALVDRRLGEAADRVLAGDVSVRPYLLGRQTPCPRCEFRTVCRFEPGVNPYRVLPPMRREDVLAKVVESADGGAT